MGTIVSNVIDGLRAADIRSDEAYPGGRIPALTGPVAAVRLGKVDRSVRTTAVQIVIMSPAAQGGSLCETTALRAMTVVQDMGGTCVKDICKFDEMASVFYIEMEAEFFGSALEDSWSAGPGYSITIGQQPMEYATSFSASRKREDDMESITEAIWEFTLEEWLPTGTSEPGDPAEPFNLKVDRSGTDEIFTDCTWVSVKRQDTIKGVNQIRTGRAEGRTVISIL